VEAGRADGGQREVTDSIELDPLLGHPLEVQRVPRDFRQLEPPRATDPSEHVWGQAQGARVVDQQLPASRQVADVDANPVLCDEPALAQLERALAEGGDVAAVRYKEESYVFLPVERGEELQDLPARYRVEGSGGLVCEYELGIGDQGTRDGDPLLLATG
ncbi:uncharacterized protein METZ01_LOCUS126826, partial [marine metagenome]